MPPTGGGSPAKEERIRLDELEDNINGMRLHATMFSQGKGMFALAGLAGRREARRVLDRGGDGVDLLGLAGHEAAEVDD